MRSPRLTERVSRISSEPRAIVSTTAAVASVIPARLIGGSRSRSHPEATRATTTGAAAPMIPALAGLVWRRPAYQRVELPTNPVSASTIAAAQSRRASGGSGPSSAREVVSLAHDASRRWNGPAGMGPTGPSATNGALLLLFLLRRLLFRHRVTPLPIPARPAVDHVRTLGEGPKRVKGKIPDRGVATRSSPHILGANLTAPGADEGCEPGTRSSRPASPPPPPRPADGAGTAPANGRPRSSAAACRRSRGYPGP
jgi:hypothetical protein